VLPACLGALAAGLVDATTASISSGAPTAAACVALLTAPALLLASALARGLVAAWRPHALAVSLIDDDGAAPRLAGWAAVLWLGSFTLAIVMFESVWALTLYTAFKPLTLSLVEPTIAITTALVLVALSRPGARLFAWLARLLDARWRRGAPARRTLLRPRLIATTAALSAAAMVYLLLRLALHDRVRFLPLDVLHAPLAGIAVTWAAHALGQHLRRHRAS
jgi:hypothetical protein